jgi:hypothetical protein
MCHRSGDIGPKGERQKIVAISNEAVVFLQDFSDGAVT